MWAAQEERQVVVQGDLHIVHTTRYWLGNTFQYSVNDTWIRGSDYLTP
jgi:hypothetical protein